MPRLLADHNALKIRNARPSDSGVWLCKASNRLGEITVEINLRVKTHLQASVEPRSIVAVTGNSARLECLINGDHQNNIQWFQNGNLLQKSHLSNRIQLQTDRVLTLDGIADADAGIYQCAAGNVDETAQGLAQLIIGDTAPQNRHTFSEQALRVGDRVSLVCTSFSNPKPRIIWTLDGQPTTLLLSQRYQYNHISDDGGIVTSFLNITDLQVEDGGLYGCNATNTKGNIIHEARMDVYGPPNIRFISPIHAVAGSEVEIYCPYYGYPISSVRWDKKGGVLMENRKSPHSVHYSTSNSKPGILHFDEVTSEDAGTYVCTVTGPSGELARREMQLIIHKPPKLVPFHFPSDMEKGGNVQVGCSVASGDLPIYFSWYKDGSPIPDVLKVEQKNMNFFSLLIITNVTAEHNGVYMCKGVNSAAATNFSSELVVKVPPQWVFEPQNVSTIASGSLVVQCSTKGHPTPTVKWIKDSFIPISMDFNEMSLNDVTVMEDGSLWFGSVKSSDRGWYQCIADNKIGKTLSKSIYVSVNEPPSVTVSSGNVTSRRGATAYMTCEASGDAPLALTWLWGLKSLRSDNERISIVTKPSSENSVTSELSIKNSNSQDSGVYKCLAENPFGKSEMITTLAIQDRPEAPLNFDIFEVDMRSIRLSWRKGQDGGSPILNYVLQFQISSGVYSETSTISWMAKLTNNVTIQAQKMFIENSNSKEHEQYLLTGLKPATTYIFRMVAVNSIDSSPFSNTVVAKTREDVPSEAPRNVMVKATHSKELQVSWKIPPNETWNGNLLGYIVYWKQENPTASSKKDQIQKNSAQVMGSSSTTYIITNLRQFTQYSVGIAAYNHVGNGPVSTYTSATTLEGVPEIAPSNVSCIALSPVSLRVWWQPLQHNYAGGVLLGYKVYYIPVPMNENEWDEHSLSDGEVKRSDNSETILRALQRYTKYSISVKAFTAAGDGTTSRPFICITDEDVPGPPADIKASSQSSSSITVSWLPPQSPNGVILHYTLYIRDVIRATKPMTFKIPKNISSEVTPASDSTAASIFDYQHTVRGLIEGTAYEVWMSASTKVGEGLSTSLLIKKPSSVAPARILSFGGTLKVQHGRTVLLKCTVSGTPTPHTKWYKDSVNLYTSSKIFISPQGHLVMSDVDATNGGIYTCAAHNSGGSDRTSFTLIPIRPPPPPRLSLLSVQTKSLRISLSSTQHRTTYLHYRPVSPQGSWTIISVQPGLTEYTIIGLTCGTVYQIYATVRDKPSVGSDEMEKSLLTLKTSGGPPVAPKDTSFLVANDTVLMIDTNVWLDNSDSVEDCGQVRIRIEVTARGDKSWMFSPVVVAPNPIFMNGLLPATWYRLKVSAANDVGMTVTLFNFATRTETGQIVAPPADLNTYFEDNYSDTLSLIIMFAAVILVGVLFATVLLKVKSPECCNKSMNGSRSEGVLKESGKLAHPDIYSTTKKQNQSAAPGEIYEISPYATFSGAPEARECGSPSRSIPEYIFNLKTFSHDDEIVSQASGNARRVQGRSRDKNEHLSRVRARTPLRCCDQYDETQLSYPRVEEDIVRCSMKTSRSPKSYQDSDTDDEVHYQKLHSVLHGVGPRR